MAEKILALFDRIWEHKNAFFVVFFVIFMLSYGILVAIDFVPEAKTLSESAPKKTMPIAETLHTEQVEVVKKVAEYPTRIKIEKIGTDVAVLNPQSTSVAVMDEALLKGVVRHPDSADFMHPGTMFLFGHSSYLPIVHNKNFQAFNGLQKLTWGDMIRVESADMEYVYRVEKVYKAVASEASVTIDNSEEKLVLVTCNSFGSKDDRFVVEAKLVEKVAL